MTWAALIPAAASLAGGAMSADAAGKASSSQAASAAASIAEQRRQYNLTRSDNAPFLQTGTAANRRLSVLLGLSPTANTTETGAVNYDGNTFSSKDALRQILVGDYVRQGGNPGSQEYQDSLDAVLGRATPVNTNEGGKPDAGYGDLTRKFTTADLNADPVYQSGLQFGLERGTEGVNARATAGGMYDSGKTLKALTQFGNDYGSTKANESRSRFVSDQDSTYNKLMGTQSGGQVATQQVASAGANAANNVSGSIDAGGNARAAGIVGGANAWGGAVTGAATGYTNYNNNQQLMALLRDRNKGTSSTSSPQNGWWDT